MDSKGIRKPKRRSLNDRDLDPDGVVIWIDWVTIRPGMSVFIPACDTKELIAQFYDKTKPGGWESKHATRIENKKLGVRFWRMK